MKEVKTAGRVTKVLLTGGDKEFNCEAVQKVLEKARLYAPIHHAT
jgi:hypothetical protein